MFVPTTGVRYTHFDLCITHPKGDYGNFLQQIFRIPCLLNQSRVNRFAAPRAFRRLLTCLSINLAVGASTGLMVYEIYPKRPQVIAANYNYRIAKCTVSEDRRYLAASTLDYELVYWSLQNSLPVAHTPTVISLDTMARSRRHTPAPFVAITPSNIIIGGMSNERLYLVDAATRWHNANKSFGQTHKVQAIVTYGPRLYIAAATGYNTNHVHIIAYSRNDYDFDYKRIYCRVPNHLVPRVGVLTERTIEEPRENPKDESKEESEESEEESEESEESEEDPADDPEEGLKEDSNGVLPTKPARPGYLKYICFTAATALLACVLGYWYVSVVGIKRLMDDDLGDSYCERLALAGVYSIHFYLPASWMAPATSALIKLLCMCQVVARLY
ncbi:hypothetical protein FRC08_000854 [Ceratobasidium sp. 394]|nr:hypothetical protein FRC08_000854 [Ceratobasidium sp. 394]